VDLQLGARVEEEPKPFFRALRHVTAMSKGQRKGDIEPARCDPPLVSLKKTFFWALHPGMTKTVKTIVILS